MTISDVRSIADECFDTFIATLPPALQTTIRPEFFLISEASLSRAILQQFLRHVSATKVPGYQRNAFIADSVQPLDGSRDADGNAVAAPSWLTRDRHEPSAPVIRLDVTHINSRLGKDAPHRDQIITKLLLHEIGHVALHWDSLRPNQIGELFLNAATAAQETEAWWFSGIIWTRVLGQVAPMARPETIDSVWYRA